MPEQSRRKRYPQSKEAITKERAQAKARYQKRRIPPEGSVAPLCACGCGRPTRWSGATLSYAEFAPMHKPGGKLKPHTENDWKRPRMKSKDETPPLCQCGCGQPVKGNWARKSWSRYIVGHHRNSPGPGPEARAKASERMKANNPMRMPGVAARVAEIARSKPPEQNPAVQKTEAWKAKIATKARKRMLGPDNPMKDKETAFRVIAKILDRKGSSKSEDQFKQYVDDRGIVLEFVGNGVLWLGRLNPDFRVPGQKKVIETTEKACFRDRIIHRAPDDYGLERIRRCIAKGWRCLVVFKGNYHQKIPEQLAEVLRNYSLPESQWCGVWHFDNLLVYDPESDSLTEATEAA